MTPVTTAPLPPGQSPDPVLADRTRDGSRHRADESGLSDPVRNLLVDSDPRTRDAVVGIARRLIEQVAPVALDADELAGVDVDLALVEAASSVFTQLGLLQRSFRTGGEHPRVITGIVDLAESYGISTSEAIGVTGSVVGVLTDGDESQIGRVLALAHQRLDDHDLVAGAAALLAATTCYVADTIAEPPLAVHDEIHRLPHDRRPHPAGGLNSQCHGSRGTRSTHPNAGPF